MDKLQTLALGPGQYVYSRIIDKNVLHNVSEYVRYFTTKLNVAYFDALHYRFSLLEIMMIFDP